MDSNILNQEGPRTKKKFKLWSPNFQEKNAMIMLKNHRKFCRCGLTHLDATHNFKNRPNTYAPPCTTFKTGIIKVILVFSISNFNTK